MEVRINRFFLSVLVSLVALVSCVQEANDGSQRLDGTVADLSGQVASLNSSLEQLNALQNVVEQDLSELSAEIEAHIGYLKSGVSRLDGTMATLQLQKNVAMVVAELQAAGYSSSVTQFVKSVKSWLGKSFETYFDVLVYACASQTIVEGAAFQLGEHHSYVDAVLSDVEAGLRDGVPAEELATVLETLAADLTSATELNSKVDEILLDLETECVMAVEALFDESSSYDASALKKASTQARIQLKSAEPTISSLVARIEAIETDIEDIKESISDLRADVDELLGMIQSLTFMSNYATDYAYAPYSLDTENKVSDPGKSYYNCGVRTPGADIELNFIVRPAAAATALTTETVSILGYYADAIQTRAIDPSKFIDFTIKSVSVTNEERGIVTVTMENNLTPDFYYKAIGAKLSLTVKADPSEIASKFIELHPLDNSGRVYVESVVPSEKVLTIKKGETTTLTATVNPSNAYNKALQWLSTDTKVVRINESTGELEAYGVGTANVQIVSRGTDEWGRSVLAECKVVVTEAITLVGPPYVEVDKTAELTLDYPAGLLVESKQWWTSDPATATVDKEGVVTGVTHTYLPASHDYGTITVYCQINGEATVSWDMKVVVTQPREIVFSKVDNNKNAFTIKLDQSLDLSATIDPAVPAEQFRILYSTMEYMNYMNGTVLNAYNNNLPIGTGYVTVKVDNVYGEHYLGSRTNVSRQIAVTVEPYYVQKIEMSDLNLNLNSTATLSPNVISDGGAGKAPTNPTLTWSSSDPDVATVDQNGLVTTLSIGQTTITAAATDGSGVKGTCVVDVSMPWKEFEVGQYVVRMDDGKIEFTTSTSVSGGTIVGVVIAKVNPRVSDKKLPAECTHGIAVGLTRTKDCTWWSGSNNVEPYNLTNYVTMYPEEGYVNPTGSYFNGSVHVRNDMAGKPCGYTNTMLLKNFINKYGLSSQIITKLDAMTTALPNETSGWYLPSVYEMDMLYQANVNNALYSVDGWVGLQSNPHWTVSEPDGNQSSWALVVNPMTGQLSTVSKTTGGNKPYLRYFFAF